ncbi:hypothetical protein BCF11_5265 [Collimonas sp. PA-H2]|uniref:hypothetical protein n=1 Tax=Collimonas sp. PA-H2 TaxID=1881062 RepID=UPI000C01E5D5|nr:hypothetical protein [Collimonas sp. PA-H2]PFH04482.1 hypothetical protein BCF11_5265 [Collimonas sp. PA-H2]
MTCNQCGKPAVGMIGNNPLCLTCYATLAQIAQQQIENAERMMNYSLDQMAEVSGIPSSFFSRLPPRPSPVVIGEVKLNNINVTGSTIGTINTGSIGTVDQSITVLKQTGEPGLADAIKALSEAILESKDLNETQKSELVDSLSAIAQEAAATKDTRRNSVALTLLNQAMKVTALAGDITDICQKWWPILVAAFSVASGK